MNKLREKSIPGKQKKDSGKRGLQQISAKVV
jgi:hypothetical protein